MLSPARELKDGGKRDSALVDYASLRRQGASAEEALLLAQAASDDASHDWILTTYASARPGQLTRDQTLMLGQLAMGPEVQSSEQAKNIDRNWVPVEGKGEFEPYLPSDASTASSLN